MSIVKSYQPHFYDLLSDRNLSVNDLPTPIQELITAYESAKENWDSANEENKRNYLDALIKSDALISALVFRKTNDAKSKIPSEKISDAKMKELKIKALKLKYNLSQLKNK